MKGNLKTHWWVALFITLIAFGCRKDPRGGEARIRRLDSIRDLALRDSTRQVSFDRSLGRRLELLDQPRLQAVCDDCIRLIVVLGWSDPTIGPMMAITAIQKDLSLRLRAFPDNKRADIVERSLKQGEFEKLVGVLDSVNFTGLPLLEEVDYQVFDANVYYIEQVRGGYYSGISRSAKVDDFVYQLVSEASLMAGLPKEFLAHFQKPMSGTR